MKVIEGYLTASQKKAIKAILEAGLTEGKVNNVTYFLSKEENAYTVKYMRKDRGLIPCAGSPLRVSTYYATFTI